MRSYYKCYHSYYLLPLLYSKSEINFSISSPLYLKLILELANITYTLRHQLIIISSSIPLKDSTLHASKPRRSFKKYQGFQIVSKFCLFCSTSPLFLHLFCSVVPPFELWFIALYFPAGRLEIPYYYNNNNLNMKGEILFLESVRVTLLVNHPVH